MCHGFKFLVCPCCTKRAVFIKWFATDGDAYVCRTKDCDFHAYAASMGVFAQDRIALWCLAQVNAGAQVVGALPETEPAWPKHLQPVSDPWRYTLKFVGLES